MKIIPYLDAVLNDENRKPLVLIIKEAIECGLRERELPFYYFTSLLYKKNSGNYKNYIGHKKLSNIRTKYINPKGMDNIELELTDKKKFFEVARENNIPVPKLLAYNNKKVIHYNNHSHTIQSLNQFKGILKELIEASVTNSLFIKRIDGNAGRDVFKIEVEDLKSDREISQLYMTVITYDFIFEETVKQHSSINDIYSNSINTIRVHTHKGENGQIIVSSALMRFGGKGSYIDNVSAGGLYVPIDLQKWKLKSEGYSYLKNGGQTFIHHPDTGFIFEGYQIPHFKMIEESVSEAAKLFDTPYIGWDICVRNKDVVIIEGNNNPHLIMAQISCGGFRKHPIYNKVFSEFL